MAFRPLSLAPPEHLPSAPHRHQFLLWPGYFLLLGSWAKSLDFHSSMVSVSLLVSKDWLLPLAFCQTVALLWIYSSDWLLVLGYSCWVHIRKDSHPSSDLTIPLTILKSKTFFLICANSCLAPTELHLFRLGFKKPSDSSLCPLFLPPKCSLVHYFSLLCTIDFSLWAS